ncbi:hypothetical protein GPECTOR_670g800 [Gonium pectorale]|uniref:Protein kinase domain-containing protein n=1 Tax=Gonium pectorale TaxID=33097 RepID=A0A150FUD5_GONPE|nr:hypothetical protein GPECTOR_670g800 [Gonium pectorale]|eukprot:KXZ41188.1 hypothetical protein GPECTOR_670g800 [Gonium pectorale]
MKTVTGGNGGDGGGGALGNVENVIPILRCPCPRSSMPPLPPSTLQRPRTDPAMADSAVFSTDSNLLATSMTNVTNLLDEQNTSSATALATAAAGGSPTGSITAAAARAAADALPADLEVVVHTGLGIASGVAYLHSRSIIHGDLSANNVLLMRTGKPAMPVVAKLSDFGLSMRLPAGQDHLKDVHHGTPYYQCPEVMERGTCSLAADVYSLGVLLWELYHGPPPWRGRRRGPAAKAKQQQQSPPPPREYLITNHRSRDGTAAGEAAEEPPHKLGLGSDGVWHDPGYSLRACDVLQFAPHCPNRYARLVRRCLAADPRDRPSARSVVKELLRMERGIAAAAAATAATAAAATTTAAVPASAAPAELVRPEWDVHVVWC